MKSIHNNIKQYLNKKNILNQKFFIDYYKYQPISGQKMSSKILFNIHEPSPIAKTGELKEKYRRQIALELGKNEGEIDFENFPALNPQNVNRHFDICMACQCMVVCLKTHFKSAHPDQLKDFKNFKAWSSAKIVQFGINSVVKKGEIEFAMQQEGIDGIIALLTRSGITVVNTEADLMTKENKFIVGDKVMGKPVPTQNGQWRTLQEPVAIVQKRQKNLDKFGRTEEEYRQLWAAYYQIIIRNGNNDEELPQPIVPLPHEGTLLNAIEHFTGVQNNKILNPPSGEIRREKVDKFFGNLGIQAAMIAPRFYTKRKEDTKIPVEDDSDLILAYNQEDITEKFYALIVYGVVGPKTVKKMENSIAGCIRELTRAINAKVTKISKPDPVSTFFYKDKKEHLESLANGKPTKIYHWDLRHLACVIGCNIFFLMGKRTAFVDADEETTLIISIDNEKISLLRKY